MQVLSVSKEYNVKRHYTYLHEEKYKKHVGEARKVMVAEYKKKLIQQTSMFSKVSTENEQSLAASYEVYNSKKFKSKAATVKMINHLWYLTEELAIISLFDDEVEVEVKKHDCKY
ncbi:hypothetical protein WA026_019514 [Henosepilachna vigintioctopunctata]|uniref:Uncharacterized protein n=1 Tax=Henosepilachna vigintioctopunctata TaxID=420089 RepID=A0AAW1TWD9_9CUCU